MNTEVEAVFLDRLKSMMDSKGVKQVDICKLTGLSSSQMHHLASGRTKSPSLSTACKIALALDVSLDYLGGLIDEPKPISRSADGHIASSRMSPAEEELLSLYRESNAQGQTTIMGVARLQPGMEEQFSTDQGQEGVA